MRLLGRLNSRQGISLVEVLVAIVIFLIGILAIVRMFPSGFLVVKHSENVTLANRLSQAEIERWKGMATNLPGGILPWGWNSGSGWTVLPDLDPDNLKALAVEPAGASLPPGTNEYYYADVNKFRRIYAEATRIPVPLPSDWSGGSVYVLAFSPVEPGSIIVYSSPLQRRSLRRGMPWLRSYSQYAIDYDKAKLYLRRSNREREFVITYSYWDNQINPSRPSLVPVVSQRILVNSSTARQVGNLPPYMDIVEVDIPAPTGAPVANDPGFMWIDHGSDSLHRKFTVASVDTQGIPVWSSDDPYEYVVKNELLGVIAFNPYGYGYEEQTTRGRQPLIAHIDYNVLDWHIIREERKLPDQIGTAGDAEFKLTLRFIKKKNETAEFDGTTYPGLFLPPYFMDPGDHSINIDFLAVDLATGAAYNESSPAYPGGPPAFTVNYKEGIVRFDPSFAGRTFRVYYKADGDWALQPFKAYDVYRRSYNLPVNYREYYIEMTSDADGPVMYLDFARCYAGCTVAVDYKYQIRGDNRVYEVDGDSHQISRDVGSRNTVHIELLKKIAGLRGVPTADVTITEITKVYGVTLGTRVIWRETGRGTQAGRWKNVDLQTYLTRMQD